MDPQDTYVKSIHAILEKPHPMKEKLFEEEWKFEVVQIYKYDILFRCIQDGGILGIWSTPLTIILKEDCPKTLFYSIVFSSH